MPVRLGNSRAVMTRSEVYQHQRAGVNIFPEEPEPTTLALYEVREPTSASRQVAVVEVQERRPKKYKKSSNKYTEYELVVPVSTRSSRSSKRYEIPPPPAEYYMAAPSPMILPPPIPQPIVAQPTPPPAAPEVPTEGRRPRPRRSNDRQAQPASSLRVEPPQSRGYSDSVSSPVSTGSTTSSRSYRSNRDGRRRSSFVSTPATSPARSQTKKTPKMIEEPSKGPKAWREQIRLTGPVVFRNADGSRTKQYYYR